MGRPRDDDGELVPTKVFEIETVKDGVPEGFPYRFPQKLSGTTGFASSVDETDEQLNFFHASYSDNKQVAQMELSIRKSTGRFRQTFDVVNELHGICFVLSRQQSHSR